VAGPVKRFVREADYRHQMTNLSPKMTANWVFASVHSAAVVSIPAPRD